MISTDKNILNEGSAVRSRMVSYGTICDKLYVLVVGRSETKNSDKNQRLRISENVFAYSITSRFKILSLFKAYRFGVYLTKDFRMGDDGYLVTAQDPFETGFIAWCISKKTKAKLQLQIHTDFLSPYFSGESFLNKVRVMISWFLLPRADRVRVVSLRIKRALVTRHSSLVTVPVVLPIFVDIESIRKVNPVIDLHKRYPQFDFIFLVASRLTREKNIGVVLEAMRSVVKKYSNAGLVIVGSGPEEDNLKSKIINYKLDGNVVLESWQDEIISYYKTADAFLLSSRYEGFGMTLVEASASGCPIISSDVGLVGDVLQKDKDILVCDSEDVDCFVNNMERFINDPQVRKEYATNAQSAVQVLNIEKDEYLEKMQESWEAPFD